MTKYYPAGESCVFRGIVNNHVWLAQSVVVVKDDKKETILLLSPGAECAIPREYWGWRKSNNPVGAGRWEVARRDPLLLNEFIWKTNRVLYFLEPEKFYACCVFWHHAQDTFNCYYINFQLPFWRSQSGFDTLDLDLDIVIDDNYKWKWKDVDEFQAGIREGGIKPEWVRGIENSKAEAVQRIAHHGSIGARTPRGGFRSFQPTGIMYKRPAVGQ